MIHCSEARAPPNSDLCSLPPTSLHAKRCRFVPGYYTKGKVERLQIVLNRMCSSFRESVAKVELKSPLSSLLTSTHVSAMYYYVSTVTRLKKKIWHSKKHQVSQHVCECKADVTNI